MKLVARDGSVDGRSSSNSRGRGPAAATREAGSGSAPSHLPTTMMLRPFTGTTIFTLNTSKISNKYKIIPSHLIHSIPLSLTTDPHRRSVLLPLPPPPADTSGATLPPSTTGWSLRSVTPKMKRKHAVSDLDKAPHDSRGDLSSGEQAEANGVAETSRNKLGCSADWLEAMATPTTLLPDLVTSKLLFSLASFLPLPPSPLLLFSSLSLLPPLKATATLTLSEGFTKYEQPETGCGRIVE
uniref:Uncharacterized protein n=1 Tax=Oryza punctata TaxID=4537 RepID=A0A0E0MIG1_ORYPU